jgi:PAS domain-containing protein
LDICFSDVEEDGLIKLYSNSKVGDEWGRAKRLSGFDTKGNDDYPFMLSDGITLYFASDGEGSIGGYDLFVTRLDTESGRFLRPDNLGMPFNSTANDYMLAINEVANLGWFATDRNQPEGSVCVYLFVPNKGTVKYDESLGFETLLSRARINSIADTQNDEEVIRKATQQYAILLYDASQGGNKNDFLFVVDDDHDYTSLSDFVSEIAREMFMEWRKRRIAQENNIALLERKRDEYASATTLEKEAMREEILALERDVEEEQEALVLMERHIRRLEQEELYKIGI